MLSGQISVLNFGFCFISVLFSQIFIEVITGQKLSEWLKNIGQGEYSKGRADMFQILRPFMDFAITNAERLDAMNEGKTPASSAPGTKVHELIKHLRPYLKIG